VFPHRYVSGDRFPAGDLAPPPEGAALGTPATYRVTHVEVWGVGGAAAVARQRQRREQRAWVLAQQRHVDRRAFAHDAAMLARHPFLPYGSLGQGYPVAISHHSQSCHYSVIYLALTSSPHVPYPAQADVSAVSVAERAHAERQLLDAARRAFGGPVAGG
jgi:hypothetical protein